MKISICIPTYNQAPFIRQAILSCARQTRKPEEIIVYDDCSTDQTPEVLAELVAELPLLRVIRQIQNCGISKNVDDCLRSATGDFVVRLDSDDYLDAHYIETLSNLLEQNPEAGYAHASVQEINQHGHFLRQRRLLRKPGYQDSTETLLAAARGYRVAANILMFRREALERVGYIKSKINFAEDYYLAASLAAENFGNVYSDQILSFYRVWVDLKKIRSKRKLDEIIGLRTVYQEVLEPAFSKRNMDLSTLAKNRMEMACAQADSLASDLYSDEEKKNLIVELKKLSDSPKVNGVIWIYMHGLGALLDSPKKLKGFAKSFIKSILSKLKK